MFRKNSLVSWEAALVVFFCCLLTDACVNENQDTNKAVLDFSKESIPCSGGCNVSNTRSIPGRVAADGSPFPQTKWRIAGSHSKSCPKSWSSSPGDLLNFLLWDQVFFLLYSLM